MNRISRQAAHSLPLAAATLAFLVGIGAAIPTYAAPTTAPAAAEPAASATTDSSSSPQVEARIKDLHTRLDITAAQEDTWGKVAQVMRQNETNMAALVKTRSANASTMTAIEDIQSYSAIAGAHADGIHNFQPVFAALYDSMSDAQKKNADAIFRARANRAMKHAVAKAD